MSVPPVLVWRCKVCMGAVVPVCCEARDPCPGACPWGERREAEWRQMERRYLQPGDWIVRVQTLRQRGEDVGPCGLPEEGYAERLRDMDRRGADPYGALPLYSERRRRSANLLSLWGLRPATNTSDGRGGPASIVIDARGSARGPRR